MAATPILTWAVSERRRTGSSLPPSLQKLEAASTQEPLLPPLPPPPPPESQERGCREQGKQAAPLPPEVFWPPEGAPDPAQASVASQPPPCTLHPPRIRRPSCSLTAFLPSCLPVCFCSVPHHSGRHCFPVLSPHCMSGWFWGLPISRIRDTTPAADRRASPLPEELGPRGPVLPSLQASGGSRASLSTDLSLKTKPVGT